MRLLKLFSRTLHFAMLFCFCLPFLKGCDGCSTPEELAAREMACRDSTAAWEAVGTAEQVADTSVLSNSTDSLEPTIFVCEPMEFPERKPPFERFLSVILQPNGDYSGLGILVIAIELNIIPIYLTLLPFILLVIISLIISFRKKSTFKWIFIFSMIEMLCLLAFYILFHRSDILYGYWLTGSLCLIHFIVSFFIWRRSGVKR